MADSDATRITAVFALACVTAVGCSEPDGDALTIPRWPALGLEVELRIDGYEEDLVPVHRIAVGRDGTIVVGQLQDRALRFFDAEGAPLGAFGRAGDGPGEFQRIQYLGWAGDTLWVYDPRGMRFTLVPPGGYPDNATPVTWNSPSQAGPAPGMEAEVPFFRWVFPYGVAPDGTLHVFANGPEGPPAEDWDFLRFTFHVRIDRDGTVLNPMVRYHSSGYEEHGYRYPISATVTRGSGFPFVVRPRYVISPDGDRSALVEVTVDGPEGGTIDVTMLRHEGDTVYHLRHPFAGVPLPDAVVDSAVADITERLRTGDLGGGPAGGLRRAAAAWEREARPRIPPVYPPLGPSTHGVIIGRDGSLWIRLRAVPAGTPYLVLDPEGAVIGAVMAPEGTTMMAVNATQAWGVELDAMDMPTVVRYRVIEDGSHY